jgi:predicted HTH transcriptional regulator
MIAFANTRGGMLLVGVSDDGTIPGVKFPDEEHFVIQQALSRFCRPAIKFSTTLIAVAPNKFVIQYHIRPGRRKLHAYVANGKKEVYVRHEDKTVQASAEMKQIIRRYSPKKNIKFRYGEHEGLLIKYLELHASISLEHYCELTGLSRYRASKSLVTLVLAHVLDIAPTEKGDRFWLHRSFKYKI